MKQHHHLHRKSTVHQCFLLSKNYLHLKVLVVWVLAAKVLVVWVLAAKVLGAWAKVAQEKGKEPTQRSTFDQMDTHRLFH